MRAYEASLSEVCLKSFMDGLWTLLLRNYANKLTREVSTEDINSILNGIEVYIKKGKHFFLDVESFWRDAENKAKRKYEMYNEGKCGLEALRDRCLFLLLARCGVALSNQHELQCEVVCQSLNVISECRFEDLNTKDEFIAWLKDQLDNAFAR